ncbi:MAG: hypothetical protein IPL49_19955 [Saprospirales bacterium]|nr:hypothetical protein [Saprospirales bacterium]MBK8493089.1 hypothetical protein [Saprospirales bacterium]
MDKLEKFITQNRDAFDREQPAQKVWSGIEEALDAGDRVDQLEQFVGKNRLAFDREVPNLKVWAAIDQALEAQRPVARIRTIWRTLRVAASVVILLTLGGLIGMYAYKYTHVQELPTLAEIAPEYAELEQYYTTQVSNRMQELSRFDQGANVQPDIQQLDDLYKELQLELDKAPKGSEEQIIQAMIRNYQIKLDILERVLEKIQTTNPKTADNETSI